MRNSILLIALSLVSIQASADWESLGSTEKLEIYIDKSTIRNQGKYVAMWTMSDYKEPQTSNLTSSYGDLYFSHKLLYLYNCREWAYGVKSFAYSLLPMGLGDVIDSGSLESYQVEFNDALPDSFGDAQLKIVCGKK